RRRREAVPLIGDGVEEVHGEDPGGGCRLGSQVEGAACRRKGAQPPDDFMRYRQLDPVVVRATGDPFKDYGDGLRGHPGWPGKIGDGPTPGVVFRRLAGNGSRRFAAHGTEEGESGKTLNGT